MGHPRRHFEHGAVALVTNRLARGMPFVPTIYINTLLFGILARATFKYPNITICAWLFMANHYHAILLNRGSAEELSAFMNFVDGEVAKVVCRLLGRWNIKVWGQRFHYAPLLTPEDCIKKMAYLFLNPVVPNLVDTASKYSGVSTYAWLAPGYEQACKYVRPKLIVRLANGRFTKRASTRLTNSLNELNLPTHTLAVEPFAWKECFAELANCSDECLKTQLFAVIAEAEAKAAVTRMRHRQAVCDPIELAEQNPHRPYIPKKYGKRVCCISSCPILRAEYIALYKSFCKQCSVAWRTAKQGYSEVLFPAGAFIPPQLPRANVVRFVT